MAGELPPKIKQIVPMLEEALTDLFEQHKDELMELKWINGISFDIIPSDNYAAISFRKQTDYLTMDPFNEDRALMYSAGDWEFYSLLEYSTCKSDKFREASQFIFDLFMEIYESSGEYDGVQQDINHLLYLAIAEAGLQPSVAQKLNEHGLGVPVITDHFEYGFEYMVTDMDSPVYFNFCDAIVANRMTAAVAEKLKL